MQIQEVISLLESLASPVLQESYDNAGLLTGTNSWNCSGILVTLDATEEVIKEAVQKNCNLVVTHHPIIFGGLKKINGKNYVERTVITAIKNDVAIYAIHTNLDNVMNGVNGKIADKLGLTERQWLSPKPSTLKKLFTFVPVDQIEKVRGAVFAAGAGHIGNYSETSFQSPGTGTFKAGKGASPFVGKEGERHYEPELKLEVIFPAHLQEKVVQALLDSHPYEEVAYDIIEIANSAGLAGSGLIGILENPQPEGAFLALIKDRFKVPVIRHTKLTGNPVKRVAICGGAGSFLISNALRQGADFYITADVKYHEFFDANGRMVIADIGHFESEQFTVELLHDILKKKYHNFAVLKSDTPTNPVHYYY
ncbi:MAG: Nif3-like dinuclear metal center hexameric protein [Bacteroidetes bacterium]|nr:MAG: Nif3-like dinuclear metal center hexameric protein [Bacteroidota bacterium]